MFYLFYLYMGYVTYIGLWDMNPTELVGSWELIDVGGQGSLESIMTAGGMDSYLGIKKGVSGRCDTVNIIGIWFGFVW